MLHGFSTSPIRCAPGAGIDRGAFAADLAGGAGDETRQDFELAHELGVGGFPTLLASDGRRLDLIAVGYRPLEAVVGTIDAWLAGGPAT